MRIDAPQNFHAGQDIEAAVEPAAVRHGINVAADEQGFFRFAAQGRPKISRRVRVNFDRQFGKFLLEPVARGNPRRRERDALRAVFVAGERAKFFQFGDGAFGIQRRIHAAECDSSFSCKIIVTMRCKASIKLQKEKSKKKLCQH